MAEGSTNSTPQRSASGEDSDSDFENENIRPRGLTGLQNLGNTCYLNSALQSLSNCPPLTQYFLDCQQLIRPDKAPMLSRSYLKLITELWHKKRPSYVVPSGVVTGIKAVHPMFRGYMQQDAQEFLRCLMDQLHEELKAPVSDDSDSEDEEDDGGGGDDDDGTNNANNAMDPVGETKTTVSDTVNRRPSFDSMSSQSELDYETCDSGLSSERSSNGGRENGSSDDNNSDTNEALKLKRSERKRYSSAVSEINDSVANTKEMKETANLLEKKGESETQNRRPPRTKAVMEAGDFREQGSASPYIPVPVKDAEGQTTATQSNTASVQHQTCQQSLQHQRPKSPVGKISNARKIKNTRYDSIISQTFDGKILSSVRCLNCETVSTTKETFQDLSLPIPSKDHLHMLHSGYPAAGGVTPPKGGACGEVHQGWFSWMFSWMKSWFIGPIITLQDCLSAFFSADELKGDNMYSCEKCKKLRNGLKYSKVLELPEILSIHLKRFRHEFYSSKISTYISFPLEGLDMEPYLHKACKNEVTTYDLVAIICHHGTAGGGHYTAYCLNHLNEQWYEFDDQYVTEVDISQVQNCEAYVLFYRKSNRKIDNLRQKFVEFERLETSILRFYVSKQWVSRFRTFAEPGPITNMDFLCKHGGVPPGKVNLIDDLVVEIHQSTWELLYNRFGGGPVCNHLYACQTCHSELEKLRQRQRTEKESFIQLNEEFQEEEHTATVYAISMAWFKEWEAFVKDKTQTPPGPIENSRIIVYKNGQPTLRQTSDYGQLSKDMWLFLHRIYGGGPELIIRQSAGASVKHGTSSPTPTQNPSSMAPLQTVASSSSLSSSSASASTPSQTSSNTSAVTPSSPLPQPQLTSFETTASQTVLYSSTSSSTSTHPVSSYTSASPSMSSTSRKEESDEAPSQDLNSPPLDSQEDVTREMSEPAQEIESSFASNLEKQNNQPSPVLTRPPQAPGPPKARKENSVSENPNLAGSSPQTSPKSPAKQTSQHAESVPGTQSGKNNGQITSNTKPPVSASECVNPSQEDKVSAPKTSSSSLTKQKPDSGNDISQFPKTGLNQTSSQAANGNGSCENLADSGLSVGNSCSSNSDISQNVSHLPDSAPETISAKHVTDDKPAAPSPSSLEMLNGQVDSEAPKGGELKDTKLIGYVADNSAPSTTASGKGRKKNKKGKQMDVTRI